MKRNILYNTDSSGGGGTAVANPPASAPKPAGTIKQIVRVDTPKPPPPEKLKGEFNVEDFPVEQLPSHQPFKVEEPKKEEPKEKKDDTNKPSVVQSAPTEGDRKPAVEDKSGTQATPQPQPILKPPQSTEKKEGGKEKVSQIQVPSANGTKQRDLTGFTQEEASVLRQMSNDAFEFSTRLLKENKELKKLESSTYLQHEQAYVLDPEYQQTAISLQRAQVESNHWLRQLEMAEKGDMIQDFQGYDKNGNPVLSQPFKPTASIVEQVRAAYQNCVNGTRTQQQKLQDYPQKYQQQIKNDHQAVEQEMKRRFEWEEKPELLDYTMPVEFEDGVKERSIKQIREDFLSLLPPYARNQMGSRIAANLMVSLRLGQAVMAQSKSQTEVQQAKSAEKSKVEPTSEQRPQKPDVKAVHGVTEFSELKL